MAHETEGRISEAFDKLTNEYRQVIFLARVLGLSHEEIGEQMDRSPEASRALLYRALGQLSVLIGLDVSGQT